jgi:cytochrome c biogenesis protein CcmG, thiol:disulfide interchange protein DsbE
MPSDVSKFAKLKMARASQVDCTAARHFRLSSNAQRRTLLQGALGVCIAAAGGLFASLARAGALEVGQPAPPLVLHTIDGRSIPTQDLLGHVIIATFWATWCEPCREELPLLSAYAKRNAERGLQVLGFSLDGPENLPKVKEVAASLSFPVGLLGSAYAGAYGRMWRIPVSFVIDRTGRLVDNGWDDAEPVWTQARLRQVVDPLLRRTG